VAKLFGEVFGIAFTADSSNNFQNYSLPLPYKPTAVAILMKSGKCSGTCKAFLSNSSNSSPFL